MWIIPHVKKENSAVQEPERKTISEGPNLCPQHFSPEHIESFVRAKLTKVLIGDR